MSDFGGLSHTTDYGENGTEADQIPECDADAGDATRRLQRDKDREKAREGRDNKEFAKILRKSRSNW